MAVQLLSCGVLLPGLVQDCTQHSLNSGNNKLMGVNKCKKGKCGVCNRIMERQFYTFKDSKKKLSI